MSNLSGQLFAIQFVRTNELSRLIVNPGYFCLRKIQQYKIVTDSRRCGSGRPPRVQQRSDCGVRQRIDQRVHLCGRPVPRHRQWPLRPASRLSRATDATAMYEPRSFSVLNNFCIKNPYLFFLFLFQKSFFIFPIFWNTFRLMRFIELPDNKCVYAKDFYVLAFLIFFL